MKMLISKRRSCLFLIMISFILTNCKKDDDIDCPDGQVQHGDHCHDENELITTLRLVFSSDGKEEVFEFKDVDGPGGDDVKLDTIVISKDTDYDLKLVVLNESTTPIEDVTDEIEKEGHYHQFFFTPTSVELEIEYDDKDKNGKPIGIENKVETKGSGEGKLMVRLKHQPAGKDGKETTGDTDIEVEFHTIIK